MKETVKHDVEMIRWTVNKVVTDQKILPVEQ